MKKFIVAVMALVMLLSVTAIASAANDTAKQFTIYNVPCKAINDDQIYQHHGDYYVVEQSGKYSLQGTTQSRYLTGGVPPVRFSM